MDFKTTLDASQQQLLKEQIGLEFLVKMYLNLVIQKEYNTIKLRSLFLHIKALPYDFDFLNIRCQTLLNLVNEGINLRDHWFDGIVSRENIVNWFSRFLREYEVFLAGLFEDRELGSHSLNFQTAPNIGICKGDKFGYHKNGITFPNFFNFRGAKYFKILNRFNYFKFNIPLSVDNSDLVKEYFGYGIEVTEYNKIHLPFFMSLTSSLKIYKK
mgnify:CR=1 FL=1